MKNKSMQIVAGTILGLLMLIAGTPLFVSGQEIKNEPTENSTDNLFKSSIVGTWQTMVTPRNCQTGAAVAPAFPGILTFSEGETLVGTSTAVISVYGFWHRGNNSRKYSFAFLSLRYSPDGTFIGTQKVRQTATLGTNGILEERSNSFTTTGSIEILDANGNTIGNGCATSTGTRFE